MIYSKEELLRDCDIAERVIALATAWKAAIESSGEDSEAANSAGFTFKVSADHLFGKVDARTGSHGHEVHFGILTESYPRTASTLPQFDEAIRAAYSGLLYPGTERRDWSTLGPLERATNSLRNSLGEGIKECWISSTKAEAVTFRLGRRIDLTDIKRKAEEGLFRGRVPVSATKSKFVVEVGSFFGWFFREHEATIRSMLPAWKKELGEGKKARPRKARKDAGEKAGG